MKRGPVSLCLFAWLIAAAITAHAAPLPCDSLYQTPLVLRDQQGRRFSLLSLRGRPVLVSMFYASCTSVCPLTVEAIERIRRAVDTPGQAELSVLMISFDPRRDHIARLAGFARAHRLDPAHWRIARTEQGDLDAFAATLGVAYRARDNGEFSHNATVALLDADGRIVTQTDDVENLDPAFIEALRRWTRDRQVQPAPVATP